MTIRETLKKSVREPDEVRDLELMRVELFRLGGRSWARLILQPGWHWAEHVGPRVGAKTCEMEHVQYILSGRLIVRNQSGEELLLEPGDFVYVAPGHDSWVVGDEPYVALDAIAGEEFMKRMKEERKAA